MADQRSGLLFLFLCWAVIKAENPPSNLVVGKVPTNPQNGGSASLNCQATAATSYEWFATDLNGYSKDISGSKYTHQASTGQLIISNLQYGQDDGYFYCVAKNNGGQVRSSRVVFQVSYLKPPSNIGASTTSAVEGGGLVFAYPEVESYPKPTITWTKDNIALQEDQRISISAAGNLYIGNVDTGDLASYKSTVRNSVTQSYYNRGPNSISFTVRDPVPPQSEIILGPINQVAISGQTSSVVFECFGSGRPMPSISWRKNGQTVTSGSKFSFDQYKKRLTIRNPSKADEGDYECHVTSSLSPQPRTSKANLTVFDQPTFRVTPSNINKYPQEAAIFACNATGIPKPTITWFHNGAKVVPSPGGRIQISSKKELKFTSLQSGDAGTVQCVATNDAGEAISAAALNIKTLDVWIDVPPKNTHALINETVELKCVGRGTPTPSISWQKNDVPINFQSNPRYLKMSSGSLRISMSKKSDSGKYTCVATNSRGNRKANATLTVLIETLITNPLPSQITAIKGAPKDLHCTVQSDPAISVHWRWTKDGSPVDTSRMTLLNDGTLRINTVQENDAGTYVCRVESVAGNATTSGTLSVQETPLAPSTPVVSNIQPTSVRLSWFPPGYDGNSPIVSYVVDAKVGSNPWRQHVDNINPSDRQMSILVRNLLPHTQYQFRVKAVNQVGVGAASAASGSIVTLKAAPSQPPSNVNGVPISADSILVQWQIPPPESHNGPLRGFKIAYRLAGVAGIQFIIRKIENPAATQGNIDGLVQFTTYEVKVLAYNDAGDGVYSQTTPVTTAEGVPTAPPQEVTVINITTTSVVLQWKPPPQKQQNGRIRGYKLQAWKGSTPSNIVQRVADHDGSVIIQRGTLTGLEKFTLYTVAVVAYNGAGDSPRSDTKIIKTEEGVPDAPGSFTVSEVYSDALRVSWDRPLRVNGVLLAYLLKHWRNDTSPSNAPTTRLPNVTLSYTVTGLSANTIYSVELSAQTRAGIGTSKRLSAMTTQSPVRPGAPHNLRFIQAAARSVVLNFTPGPSGRAPILTYTIEYNNDSFYDPFSARWKTLMIIRDAHLVWNLLPLTLPNLKPYTDYRFRVIAKNKVGSSSPSNASDTIKTLETAPSHPPSNLKVIQVGKDGLELRWKIPPRDTWNSDYIGFLMKFEPQGVSSSNTLEIKIPNSQLNYYRAGGLLKYKHYRVSVSTYNLNGLGTSNKSAVAWAWTQEDAPSRAPSGVKPTVTGASNVTLNWGPVPAVGQNGQILGYKIYYSVVGRLNTEKEKQINHGATYSTALTELEAFVTYEFQVLAYTRIGNGPRSSPVRATTLESTPGPPAHVRFTAVSNNFVTIVWDPPVYPHGVITGYKALCRLNQTSSGHTWKDDSIGSTERQTSAGTLSTANFYRFFLWAKTDQGWSEKPAEAVVFTGGSTDYPDAPFILPIYFSDIGERWIVVKWQATSNVKSPLRYFTLQLNKNVDGWQVYSSNIDHTARSFKVEGLIPGESYMFRIMATNDKGNSPYSAASTPTTTRLALPTGAPYDVRIRAASTTSLLIEWTAPSPQELGGTLKGFIVKYRQQGSADFTNVSLPSNSRQYALNNLKVFTVYGIMVAAVNEKGPGPYTPEYNVTTGEKPPSDPPTNLRSGRVTRTSIEIMWAAPSPGSFNGHLMGYKVYAEDLSLSNDGRRRRRSLLQVHREDRPLPVRWKRSMKRRSRHRRALPVCLREPGPKVLFVPPHQTTANITSLRKFVTYRIWVRAYNSIGESPPSPSREIKTQADKPGPPAVFTSDAVYNTRVDLSWTPPCEPNGQIIEYEIKYGMVTTNTKKEVIVSAAKEKKIINDLEMLTAYSFQIRARNPMGYSLPKTFVKTTKGPAVLPGKPGKPVVMINPGFLQAVISWINGDSGNIPFEKFEIQSKVNGSTQFQTNWEANPDETKKNKSYVYYTLGNLEPNRGYIFRIIAWNAIGRSPPSDPSDIVFTGNVDPEAQEQIFYKRWWFILLMVFFALCLIFLILGFIFVCYRRRRDKAQQGSSLGPSTTQSTLEMMRSSRNGTIRSGTLPTVQITYRDTAPADEEASSVESKEELSDDSDSGVSEVTYKRKANIKLMNQNTNSPSLSPWRDSLGRPRSTQRPSRNRNLIEHTTEESDAPDEIPVTRGLKSFSVMSLPRDQRDVPPAYDGRRYMAKSADHLDQIQRGRLPAEAVTSFISSDYEQRHQKPAYRDRQEPYSRSRPSKPTGALRTSRDRVDYNDDSSSPPQSPTRPNFGNFSYSPKTEIQRRSRREPRSSSFRRALQFEGNPQDSDGSSKYSDRASSSSNDHRDTKTLVDSRNPPRIQYDEEPGRRRPPKLQPLVSDRLAPYPSSRPRGPPSPGTPVSPAPSYHAVDPVYGGRISPSYGSNRDEQSDQSDGRDPRVMYLDRNAYNNDTYQSSDPHISSYSSFV